MRLVDADAMKDTNDNVIAVIDPETKSKYWISLNNYINAQPTVDTIKHGHWYYAPDRPVGCGTTIGGMFCSNCGGDCPSGSHPYREFKYCPYCGARMDDEVTE